MATQEGRAPRFPPQASAPNSFRRSDLKLACFGTRGEPKRVEAAAKYDHRSDNGGQQPTTCWLRHCGGHCATCPRPLKSRVIQTACSYAPGAVSKGMELYVVAVVERETVRTGRRADRPSNTSRVCDIHSPQKSGDIAEAHE